MEQQSYIVLLQVLIPVIILMTGASLCLLVGVAKNGAFRHLLPWISLISIGTAIGMLLYCDCVKWTDSHINMYSEDNSLHVTTRSFYASLITLVIGAFLLFIGWYPDDNHDPKGDPVPISAEFFSMFLFSLSGVVLVTMANNLVVLFLALELVSVPTYVMVTLSRPVGQAREAGLKYFFLGAMAAGLLVYGFSLIYGISGTIFFDSPISRPDTMIIQQQILSNPNPYYFLALVIIIAGLCFKVAALPLHFYVADVYQGASNAVTAMLAFLPKFAGFYSLYIILKAIGYPLWQQAVDFTSLTSLSGDILWWLAAGTMTVGNILALRQSNVKRILAYSSVAHTGYMMLALIAGTSSFTDGTVAIFFYVAVYAVSTLGAFGVLSLLQKNGDEVQELSDLYGLSKKYPGLAAAMAICVFSLIGMPFTGGFIGKLYVFSSLVQSSVPLKITLLVVALINAAVAAYYYLKILGACYLQEGQFEGSNVSRQNPQLLGVGLACVATLVLGLMPGLLADPMQQDIQVHDQKQQGGKPAFVQGGDPVEYDLEVQIRQSYLRKTAANITQLTQAHSLK